MDKELPIRLLGDHRVLHFAKEQLRELFKLSAQPLALSIQSFVIATFEQLQEQHLALCDIVAAPLHEAQYSDEFIIKQLEGVVYLIGCSERAVLYAVYQYGESSMGLHWIYPGKAPTRIVNEMYNEQRQHYKPVMERRGFVFETIDDVPYMQSMVIWLAQNKINELFFTFTLWDKIGAYLQELIIDRGFMITLGGHSTKFFLERQAAEQSLKANHPYTAKQQLDYTDLSWQLPLVDSIAAYCAKVPNFKRLSLWPEDIKHQQSEQFLAHYIAFTERMQSGLQQAGLQVEVEHIAYNAGLAWDMLEKENLQSSSVIDTLYAYWGRDYRYPYIDAVSDSDRRAHEALLDWISSVHKQGKEVTMFEYYSDHFMLSPIFPMLPTRIAGDISYYASIGIDGMTNLVVPCPANEHYSWQWNHSYNSYLYARSLWKESLEVINEHYYQYFPATIRGAIRSFFTKLEEHAAALTSWNTPLFPARAVDAAKAIATDEERQLIVTRLDEIVNSAEQCMRHIASSQHDEIISCLKHYIDYSNDVKAQWLKREDTH